MTKETALQKVAESQEQKALAIPAEQRLGQVSGWEKEDFVIPRIHLFQGTPREKKNIGNFQNGDLVNCITLELLQTNKFMVIDGFKDFAEVDKDGKPIKISRNKKDWPLEDVDWNYRQSQGFDDPPPVMQRLNFIVLFEGEEYPFAVRFKKTSYKAGKTLGTMARMHQGKMLYAFEHKEESNDKGAWMVPIIKPAGKAPDDMYKAALLIFEQLNQSQVIIDDGNLETETTEETFP